MNEATLDDMLARLEAARSFSPRAVSKLEAFIRAAGDDDLFRLNPLRYAQQQRLDEAEAIDLFLHASRVGLFDLAWHMVCAFCGHVVESLGDLSRIHAHYRCSFCSAMNEAVLEDTIHATFTVSRSVREIAFHSPDELEIDDYALRFCFAKGVTFANGASLAQLRSVITKHLSWLDPGAHIAFEIDVEPGMLGAKDVRNRTSVELFVDAQVESEQSLDLTIFGAEMRPTDRDVAARKLKQTHATFEYDRTGDVRSGKLRVKVHNASAERSALWVVHLPAGFESSHVTFEPFLSGRRLLTTQTFRDLFHWQTFAVDEGLRIRDLTFVFTDLKGSTEMYDRVGDVSAFFLVRRHFDVLANAVVTRHGAIVKTIGDAVMAAFETTADAVAAALDMLAAMEKLNEGASTPLHLKVGVHRGPAIAVTLNDRIDYFGQTVNVAARIQGIAGANELYLGQSTYEAAGVRALLGDRKVDHARVTLKGVAAEATVVRVAAGKQPSHT